jgi:hypothetical protein
LYQKDICAIEPAAREEPGLRRLDDNYVSHDPHEICLFAIVRDEIRRLPFFLQYYSRKGVSRFFIVDNDSTDGTTDLLLSTPDVHVFHTANRYSQSRYGLTWIRSLLDSYGQGRWCIAADADEFLVYPGWEQLSLPELCAYLDSQSSSAFASLLLDMYSDKPFSETHYAAGSDPLTVCPYFDPDTIIPVGRWPPMVGGRQMHAGGMRKRLFGLDVNLDKICLVKYRSSMQLHEGMHALGGASISQAQGAVLHFKYLFGFAEKAQLEAMRREHWQDAVEYRRYAAVLGANPELTALTSASVAFRGSDDLIEHKIMKSTVGLDRLVATKRGTRPRPPSASGGASSSKIAFFVVGTGRCGSTLLRDLLNLHPEIFAPAAESHWIPWQYERCGSRRHPLTVYTDVVERVFYVTGELTVDVMAAGIGISRRQLFAAAGARLSQQNPTIVEFNDALYGALAAAAGRSLVGDNTPCYCLHIPLLHGLWPDARFIHVIRDGRDVALSMSKHPGFRLMVELRSPGWPSLALDRRYSAESELGREPSLEDYIGLWDLRLRRALDGARHLSPGAYLEIRYEDLVRDPRTEMRRLGGFLDVSSPREWLAQAERKVRVGNAKEIGDRSAWEALTALGSETLAELGYPT